MAEEKEPAAKGDESQGNEADKITTPSPEQPVESGKLDSESSEKVAIIDDTKGQRIDENSEKLTSIIASLTLNELQKKEVKDLLKAELEQSVLTLKTEMKKESEDTKKDFLTFFGLFASFVTFLSIEIQLFKNSDNILELVGVSSLSLSFVMFFALILNEMIKGDYQLKDLAKPKYLINLSFLVVGVACLFFGSYREVNRLAKIEGKQMKDSTYIFKLNTRIIESNKKIDQLDSLLVETQKELLNVTKKVFPQNVATQDKNMGQDIHTP